ncbi:variable large family protein [Borrelia crocidurae]|nr:variable large family protein [Borrelia crocidurae]
MVMMVVMMVIGCNSGGGSGEGKVNLEAKNSFLESLVKIGEGFQEIFGVFGSAIGDVLGFNVVKSGDTRNKIGEHFEKIGNGLTKTDKKLKELAGRIYEAKNADVITIEAVKGVVKGVNDVFEQLISALIKLADVTKDGNPIGDNVAGAAVAAEEAGVRTIIDNIKEIIEVAKKSGINVDAGIAGVTVIAAANGATDVLGGNNGAGAGQGAGPKLANEVSKADAWAMIDKIKNATTVGFVAGNDNNAGQLVIGGANANGAKAATNADLAAAVALKAMTKSGKFSANAADDGAVKAAAVSAVNKVLGVLDVIIRRTVVSNLNKVREAVKGIKYSESSVTEASQSDTAQTTNKQ